MRRALLAATIVSLGPLLPAQEKKDKRVALKEFQELALKKVRGFEEMRARGDALKKWIELNADTEFGEWNFAKPVARYFGRDYATAGTELLAYLGKHGKLPVKDYDVICGRVLLNHAVTTFRGGSIGKGKKSLELALALYDKPATIYAAVGRVLGGIDDDRARSVLLDLTKRATSDRRLTERERVDVLGRMFAKPAKRRPRGPTTIKPFKGTDLDGNEIALADYRGKVVLVDFWATWCGPCLREMPNVVKAYEKYHPAGFEVIGISLDGPNATDKIREVMKKHGMTWPQIYDGGRWKARLATENNIRSIPATFLFDRSGKCRASGLRGADLDREVRKLLHEKEGRGR